jgi:hypothetical protein
MRKRPFQTEPHGAIVGRRQFLGCGHQRVGEAAARGKAADAGDDVARQHRLLVVKAQSVAQCQGPGQPILLDLMSLDHLRLGCPIRVDAVERIEDEISVIARLPLAGGDRVEHAEVYVDTKDQLVGPLRPPDPRRGERRSARGGGLQQFSSTQGYVLPVSASPRCQLGPPIELNVFFLAVTIADSGARLHAANSVILNPIDAVSGAGHAAPVEGASAENEP